MKREFISIDALKKVLSPKEMKNVTGGSGSCTCVCGANSGPITCSGIADCEEQCYWRCGDGGWMTNCY